GRGCHTLCGLASCGARSMTTSLSATVWSFRTLIPTFGGLLTSVGNTAFRYTCEQHEGLAGYGWDEYDIRRGGILIIRDVAKQIDISLCFVKVPGGTHGGSWAARIKGVPRADAPEDLQTMLTYYIAQEGGGELSVQTEGTELGFDDDILFAGKSRT